MIEALRGLVAGGDLTNEQLAAVCPDPRLLDHAEKAAWAILSHWADDGDIRAKYPRYGDQQLNVIAEMARRLET